MSVLRSLAAGFCLLVVAGAGLAEDSLLLAQDEARRLLDAGKAELSVALLERHLLRFTANADYDYLLGVALYQAGQPGRARFAFERVLMVAPDNVDARLKLAQIEVERGGVRYAKELLEPLLAHRLDAGQQQQMAQIRAGIASAPGGTPFSVRGYVLGGIGWDDNVTGGPRQTSLIIPGLGPTATVLGSAARDGDRVRVMEAGVSLGKAIGEGTWLSAAGASRWGDNARRDDVQEGLVNLDLGLLQRRGSEFFGAALVAQNYRVGNATYRKSQGARLHWTHPFDDSLRLVSVLQSISFDFPEHPMDNAARTVVGVSMESTTAGGARSLRFGIYGGEEKAKDRSRPHFGFDLVGLQLGGSLRLRDDLSVAVGAIYEERQHLAQDPLYLLMRRDQQFSLGLSAEYRLSQGWYLVPQYSATRNTSSTALYAYTRNAFMLHLRWDFNND